MPTDDERLVIDLEARIRDFERNFQKANRTAQREFGAIELRAKQAADRIERSMATSADRSNASLERLGKGVAAVSESFKGAVAGFAAGLLTNASVEFVTKSVGELAKLNDVAERTGASSSFLQEFAFAVTQSGGAADDAGKGLEKFSVNVSKAAAGGGDLAKVFEANGVALRDTTGKLRPLEALLGDFAELIKNTESEQDRLNLATMAFGRSAGPALVLALSQGRAGLAEMAAEANKAGLVLGDKLVKEAARLDDEFAKMSDRLSGLGRQFAVEFGGPAVEAGMKVLLGYLEQVKATIEDIRNLNLADLIVRPEIRNMIAGQAPQFGPRSPDDERAELERQQTNITARIATAEARIAAATAAGRGAAGSEAQLAKLKADLPEIERRIAAINANPLTIEYQPTRAGYTAGGATVARPTVMPGEGGTGGAGDQSAVFKLIAKFESFISSAKWDVNAYRVGYGSDTTTAADGSVSRVTASTITTMADATRDLNRRIAEFQNVIRGQIGGERFAGMSDEQQAALTSIAYNYGELPNRIVKAIMSGTTDDVGKAIRGLGGDNSGINRRRRDQESEAYTTGVTPSQRDADTVRDAAATAADRQAAAVRRVMEALDLEAREIGKTAQEQEVLARLQQAGVDLSSREGQAIRGKVSELYALKTAQDSVELSADAAKRARETLADMGADATTGILRDLREGATAAEAFGNALGKIADQLIEMAVKQLFQSAFAAPAGGSGGLGGGFFGFLGSLFGFADGGFTGDGGKHEPAGIVHRGEFVFSKAATARLGVGNLERMHKGAKGYANGGLVGGAPSFRPASLPVLPAPIMPRAIAPISGSGMTSSVVTIAPAITVNASGGTPDQNDDLSKKIGAEVENSMKQLVGQELLKQLRPGGMLDTASRRR